MEIPRSYQFTSEIGSLLATIEANKAVINTITLPLEIEENLRGQSILGSAIFSARIEGNMLTRAEVGSFSDLSSDDKSKVEIANLYRAIKLVLEDFSKPNPITLETILKFHAEVMKNILFEDYLGKIRTQHEGIFDPIGNIIYEAPPPKIVLGYMNRLVEFISSDEVRSIPLRAVLAHLTLEDIHPFVDGNGRIGRLLQLMVLTSGGYGMKGFGAPEELIEKNRQSYYRAIELCQSGKGDATEFVELMLRFLAESSTDAKELLLGKQKNHTDLDFLLPRRREIVEIIREQKMVSLDFLHRRFLKISERQLTYDLSELIKAGYIQKKGSTRGAMYGPKE